MSGLYLHIPFCHQACSYCNFHFSTSLKNKSPLLQAIQKEIVLRKDYLNSPVLQTIYFGGGTPSLLDLAEIESLLNTISKHFIMAENAEISLEANPEDLTLDKSKALKNMGFNRLSLGIQSFDDEDLIYIGRKHTGKQALSSIENVQKAGFDNITTDLIYGIQTSDSQKWQENLKRIKEFDIPHLSAYALTIEPKTIMEYQIRKKQKQDVDEELLR